MTLAPRIFAALADPTRLRIVALLRAMELSVGELAQVLGQSQPRVSRHVRILIDAGLAERRKEGSWVFLSLGRRGRGIEPLFALIDALGRGRRRRSLVRRRRRPARRGPRRPRRRRRALFRRAMPANGTQIRSLHVAESEVEAAIGRALGGPAIGRLVDIGTGTGRMIELFGRRAPRSDRHRPLARNAPRSPGSSSPRPGSMRSSLRQGDMYALPLAVRLGRHA